MIKFIKAHWKYLAVIVPLALAEIGWRIHVETELNRSDRLTTVEELITPLVTEWKAEQLLRERGYFVPVAAHEHPEYAHEHASPTVAQPQAPPSQPEVEKIRKEADDWARQMIQEPMKN